MKLAMKVFLIVAFLFVSCNEALVSRQINMILLNDADFNLDKTDVKAFHNFRRSKFWFKFHVSPEWFEVQRHKLQKKGYPIFNKSNCLDLPMDVFTEKEWGKFYWYSSFILPTKRYSIYYNNEDQLLTLVVFYH